MVLGACRGLCYGFGGDPEFSHVVWGILEFSGFRDLLGRVDLEVAGILCEEALGRATSKNGNQRVNPTPYTVCGFFFFFSSPRLLVFFCPFLSCPISLPGFQSSLLIWSPLCATNFIYLVIIC